MRLLIIFLIFFATLNANKTIEVNLSKQKIYAKENGNIVFSGLISSGKSGHRTPRGNFRVIDKEKFHISNKYPEPNGGAKMPYMLRLTNSGLAIHQGYLPGYPASHGCIRVSKSTAKKLWYWANRGVRVKIYGNASNFKYVKKRKRRYKKKHYKKHYAKRKRYKPKRRHYAKSSKNISDYEVVEIYDSW